MKTLIAAAFVMLSSIAAANEIIPSTIAYPVTVNEAQAIVFGSPWPQTTVKITSTFGNACSVPQADELVVIPTYEGGYGTLILTVGYTTERMCTAEYAPVTVTINLGTYTRPNDGLFDRIVVNGKEAVVVTQ